MTYAQSLDPIFNLNRGPSTSRFHDSQWLNVPYSSSFDIRLIEAVRGSPCLYNARDRLYRSAEHKMEVWNGFIHSLHFDGSATKLYNRWKQLRDKYGKEKKRMKNTGVHSKWQYFNYLKFLDPHMTDREQRQYALAKDGKPFPHQMIINRPNFSSELIREVRHYPCLYDIRDPAYRRGEYRYQSWVQIIRNLAFPGDTRQIYKQWKKVRDRYVRERRKIRMSNLTGDVIEESQWKLFPQMAWIDPYLDDRNMLEHIVSFDGLLVKGEQDDDESSDDGQIDEIMGNHLSMDQSTHADHDVNLQSESIRAVQSIQHSLHPNSSSGPHAISQVPASSIVKLEDLFNINGDKSFALSVAADLMSLPEESRRIVKAQIKYMINKARKPSNQNHI